MKRAELVQICGSLVQKKESQAHTAVSRFLWLVRGTGHQKSCFVSIPKNVHFSILASSFVFRLNAENFRSSYLLVPEIKVLHTRSFHRLMRLF
jgi:hypothetical protein